MGDINAASSNETIDPESDFEDIINQIEEGEEDDDSDDEINVGGFDMDVEIDTD